MKITIHTLLPIYSSILNVQYRVYVYVKATNLWKRIKVSLSNDKEQRVGAKIIITEKGKEKQKLPITCITLIQKKESEGDIDIKHSGTMHRTEGEA